MIMVEADGASRESTLINFKLKLRENDLTSKEFNTFG